MMLLGLSEGTAWQPFSGSLRLTQSLSCLLEEVLRLGKPFTWHCRAIRHRALKWIPFLLTLLPCVAELEHIKKIVEAASLHS